MRELKGNERVTRQSYVEICRLILANVDDKYPVNQHGDTPLDLARKPAITYFKDDELQELEQLWLDEEAQ